MIIGVGCDIVKISRIEKLIKESGERFLNKIFTALEIELAPRNNQYNYFAKRFAAKEAVVKALGTGFGEIAFHDIEITNNDLGKPIVNFNSLKGSYNIHLSLSDEEEYAVAYVVIEGKR